MRERILDGEALVLIAPVILCGLPGEMKAFLDGWLDLLPSGRLTPRAARLRVGYVATYAPDDSSAGDLFHAQVRGILSAFGMTFRGGGRAFVAPGALPDEGLLRLARRVGEVLAAGEGFAGYPEEYLEGIARYHAGEYWEAHESWEEIWLAEETSLRLFYQGLIQVTAAFHHHGNGNWKGMANLLRTGTEKLESFRPRAMGLDLDAFLAELEPWRTLAETRCGRPAVVTRVPGEVPRILLDPPPPG